VWKFCWNLSLKHKLNQDQDQDKKLTAYEGTPFPKNLFVLLSAQRTPKVQRTCDTTDKKGLLFKKRYHLGRNLHFRPKTSIVLVTRKIGRFTSVPWCTLSGAFVLVTSLKKQKWWLWANLVLWFRISAPGRTMVLVRHNLLIANKSLQRFTTGSILNHFNLRFIHCMTYQQLQLASYLNSSLYNTMVHSLRKKRPNHDLDSFSIPSLLKIWIMKWLIFKWSYSVFFSSKGVFNNSGCFCSQSLNFSN
jgi:hypothetical protein